LLSIGSILLQRCPELFNISAAAVAEPGNLQIVVELGQPVCQGLARRLIRTLVGNYTDLTCDLRVASFGAGPGKARDRGEQYGIGQAMWEVEHQSKWTAHAVDETHTGVRKCEAALQRCK